MLYYGHTTFEMDTRQDNHISACMLDNMTNLLSNMLASLLHMQVVVLQDA